MPAFTLFPVSFLQKNKIEPLHPRPLGVFDVNRRVVGGDAPALTLSWGGRVEHTPKMYELATKSNASILSPQRSGFLVTPLERCELQQVHL